MSSKTDEQKRKKIEKDRRYYDRHKERIKAELKERLANDPVFAEEHYRRRRENHARWRANHPETAKQKAKRQYERNKENVIAQSKKWAEENRKRVREIKKGWKQRNKEYCNEYARQKAKTDLAYRVKRNLRASLSSAVRRFKAKKFTNTIKLLGCEIGFFIQYLTLKFEEGMSWDNYGEWHIDHIQPCASFDLTIEEQQRACFHYTNLQPLWGPDNIRKSDMLPEEWEKLKAKEKDTKNEPKPTPTGRQRRTD